MGSSFSSELCDEKWSNNSSWMNELPEHLHCISLTKIAIPGSHDSFTYDINKSNDICKVNIPEFLRKFVNCRFVRYFIYNWSITQTLNVIDQLENGIRYFDIRVASKVERDKRLAFYVHGMYSRNILQYLEEMKEFLESHRKEVVLLDFNHFYDMFPDDHCQLIENVLDIFGSMVCPVRDLDTLSLEWMWSNGYQVIIIYHCSCDPVHEFLWSASSIRSRWPDKRSCEDVVKFLDEEWSREREFPSKFKVYQEVLTPDTNFILKRIRQNLKESLIDLRAFEKFVKWIRSRPSRPESEITKNQANIFIADFIELNGFADAVINLNLVE